MEKAQTDVVQEDGWATDVRPHYVKAVECVEKRLAALRQAPPIATGSRGSCRLNKLNGMTPSTFASA